jgi:hypothetical protein
MNCFECARGGSTTTAVALCRHCNAGLCVDHLRDAATDRPQGGLHATCRHSTWDVRSWSPRSLPEANRMSSEARALRSGGARVLATLLPKHGR